MVSARHVCLSLFSDTQKGETSLQEPPYAELHCRSNFSFLEGGSHPEELVERAHALGYEAIAITDRATLAGTDHVVVDRIKMVTVHTDALIGFGHREFADLLQRRRRLRPAWFGCGAPSRLLRTCGRWTSWLSSWLPS